jgi:hypothetical protein
MRVLFHRATLSLAIMATATVGAAENRFSQPVNTAEIMNSNDHSVVLTSCQGSCGGTENCNSDSCGSTFGDNPMRFKTDTCDCGNWFQNTTAFSGVEAFKTFGDSDFPNNAGFVSGLNTGFQLGGSKIQGQIGGSLGLYDSKGRPLGAPTQTESQGFLTAGIFKRSNVDNGERLSWGLVYDQLWNHQYGVSADDITLGQFRGIMGVALNPCNEVGFWGTAHTNSQTIDGVFSPTQSLQAINQYNLFWSHSYALGARSMLYAGLADSKSIGSWQTGTQFTAPMSQRLSLYGNSAFMFPSSATGPIGSTELLWSVSCGLSYSFGGKAVSRNISGPCGTPLQQVANNGTFMVGGNSFVGP